MRTNSSNQASEQGFGSIRGCYEGPSGATVTVITSTTYLASFSLPLCSSSSFSSPTGPSSSSSGIGLRKVPTSSLIVWLFTDTLNTISSTERTALPGPTIYGTKYPRGAIFVSVLFRTRRVPECLNLCLLSQPQNLSSEFRPRYQHAHSAHASTPP